MASQLAIDVGTLAAFVLLLWLSHPRTFKALGMAFGAVLGYTSRPAKADRGDASEPSDDGDEMEARLRFVTLYDLNRDGYGTTERRPENVSRLARRMVGRRMPLGCVLRRLGMDCPNADFWVADFAIYVAWGDVVIPPTVPGASGIRRHTARLLRFEP
jgi:hypothetical protein